MPHFNPTKAPITNSLEEAEVDRKIHGKGGIPYATLRRIEEILPANMEYTAETGCGRSTIIFSNLSENHKAFCLDDRKQTEKSSVLYFENSSHSNPSTVKWIHGPTQKTLPQFNHECTYDCVLIDGPHGYPFPDMEYNYFYSHIKMGGYLIIDDIQIASVGRMADIIQEDAMWELTELVSRTAVFRRTEAPSTPPFGDHWFTQDYNRRRTYKAREFFLDDGKKLKPFSKRLVVNPD